MTDVSTRHFYQFLAQFNKGGETWVNVADSYGKEDGIVLKCEFQDFMNDKWNGEESLTNDLINKFWKEIDTKTSGKFKSGTTSFYNLNALDGTEIDKVNEQLEVYIQFEEFVSKNVLVPTVLTTTGSQWLSDVKDELSSLLDKYITEGSKGDLNEYLSTALPAIKNKYTAQYCAVEYQETLKATVFKDYPDYKVADDSTLLGLLNQYMSTVDEETNATAIKEEIRNIIDSYLAHAGLGSGDKTYIVDNYGYKPEQLSPLQIEVIKQTIKNDLKEESQKYKGYESEFDTALTQFIESKINIGGTFESLKGCAQEFLTSEYKTQLDNAVKIDKTYKDVVESTDPDSFYQKLVQKFGENLAKKIAANDRYLEAYKNIISDVKTKVSNGELTMDEVENYILEQISKNLDKFYTNGFGDMSIEELNATYDKLAAIAESQEDDETALTQHRQAAIQYCDALVNKSTSLKQAVESIFGTDYKGTINSLYPGEIAEKMTELKAKALQIGDIANLTDSDKQQFFTGIKDSYDCSFGQTLEINPATSVVVGGNTITTDRIEYQVSGALIKKDGKIMIDTSKAGTYTGTITMIIDGIEVSSKTITVTVQLKANLDNDDTTQINGDTIKNIMLTNNNVIGASNWVRPGSALSAGKTFITSTLDTIQSSLINGGYDADKTKRTIDILKKYYIKILEDVNANYRTLKEKDYDDKGITTTNQGQFTYQGSNGRNYTLTLDANWKEYKNAYDFGANEITCTSGFGISHERKGDDNYKFYFNTKALLSVFKTVYDSI